MEKNTNYNIYEKLAAKYGMSIDQAKANCRNLEQTAKSVGLDFHFETMILTNTFDAHRLVMHAKQQGFMKPMTERILRAYYTESKHIGDHQVLIDLAQEVGLDREGAAAMLASDSQSDAVRADEKEADAYGIRSIPFFLINKKYAITGAQPTETFVEALQQIHEQDGPFTLASTEGPACDENGCEIPK